MKNNFKFLIVLAILLTACLCIGSTFAADISVNNIDDVSSVDDAQNIEIASDGSSQEEVPNLQADEGTYDELQDEIFNAVAGSTINLTKDYIFTDAIDGVFIDKSLTIDGQGHTIDGTNSSNIFQVSSNDVIIKNINFINTKSTNYGGAISWGGVNGCVSGCSFINCSASDGGGAISWDGVNGCVSGCSFINCSSSMDGGAIDWVYSNNGCVSGCSFINCSSSMYGGAISWRYSDNGVVSGCSFINCSASSNGGAIYWFYSDNGVVSGCSFINCSASRGGAIYWLFSEGSVNYNVFEGNVAERYGDAIYIDGSCDCDYNFFGFENTVTTFPTNLVYGVTPSNWVVLNISKVNGLYSVNFICNNGSTLTEFMPDYIASLNIDGDVKDITIKNNTFKDAPICGDYLLTSINSGNALARATLNWNTTSYNISTTNCTYGENATVTVKINESATGNITVKVDDGQVIPMPIDNGVVIITIFNLSVGVHNLNISYSGDDNYLPFETTEFTVTVYKTTPEVIVSVENVTYGEDVTVNVNLDVVNGTGNITYYLNGKEYATEDISNLTLVINNLSAGTYYLTVEYSGDLNNTKSSAKCNFTVSKNNTYVMSVSAINVTVGEDEVIVVNVPTDAIGNVIICVNGTNYSATVKEGVATLTLKDLKVGNYTVTASFSDSNYDLNSVSTNFTVKNIAKLDSFVSVDDVSCKLNCPVDLVAHVVGDIGYVTFYVNDIEINSVKLVDGVAKLSYYANVSGNFTVKVVYSGSDLYSSSVNTSTLFVNSSKFKSNVVVDSVVITKGDSVNLVAHLDSDATGFITFYVNGSKIGISEVEDGIAKYTYVPNNVGKYVIKAVYTGDDKYSSSEAEGNLTVKEISKLGTNLTASGLTINAYASKNLVVTLKDSNGKVLSGKKLTIVFNGKNYTVTTNASGQAKLSITSKVVKNYTATIKFAGDTAYTGSSKSVKVVIKPAYVTVADIIKAAKTLKSYSVKNKKLPSTIKVGSYKLTHAQLTYLMTVAIKHIKAGKKTSTKVKVINVKYTTYNAKISKKIMKNGYLSVVNTLYSKGVKGTLPKYFTYGGKKVGYNAYAYSLAKILAFYSSKHRLPNYCVFVNY